jgi:hypothetical protein
LEKFIKKITEKLDKAILKIETKIIKEELWKFNYETKLFEKICKKIYWKEFNITKITKYSIKEVIDYHNKYYKLDNMIICDENYNILKNSYIYKKSRKKEFSFNCLKLYTTLNWYKNYALIKKYETRKDYYLFFFLQELIDAYFYFKYRYEEHNYYYDYETFLFRTEELNTFVLSWKFDINFNLDFFKEFKKAFCNIVLYDFWREWVILNKLLLWVDVDSKKLISYLNSIKYEYILSLLWKKEDYKNLKLYSL